MIKQLNLPGLFKLKLLLIALLLIGCSSENDPKEDEMAQNAMIEIISENNTTIDFGQVVQGAALTKQFEIKNTGSIDLIISNITTPAAFTVNQNAVTVSPSATVVVEVTFSPETMSAISGDLIIISNAISGENSLLLSGIGTSNIFEGDVILRSQQEIDDFGALGYIEITGNLYIGDASSPSITDLTALSNLEATNGLDIKYNPQLSSLQGLENLAIENRLVLVANNLIENYNVLSGISNTLSILQIAQHPNLNDLSAFENMTSLGYLFFSNNDLITDLSVFLNLTTIINKLEITNNVSLTNLDGLTNVIHVGNTISISFNEQLSSYCGLVNLIQTQGLQFISFVEMRYNRYNPSGASAIINQCEKAVADGVYDGFIRIGDTSARDYFISKNYTTIDGELAIVSGADTTGLTNTLTNITGDLFISSITSTDLNGLENLTAVGANIYVNNCSNLTDFCALNNVINSGNFNTLSVSNNAYNPSVSDFNSGNCSL
ncbi:DUF1573 domain-containing protein [Lacinutrix sp. Hel_I_90]|uniref:Ig-like domain-containing protein n=1 Tax=Lacinutrix sp. Hel_I_90 TaxID=1249999 RepID=UPI0005C8895F|nr:DUF1573 domain-containing protein [Lacinutrix sp. Hel_I_90]